MAWTSPRARTTRWWTGTTFGLPPGTTWTPFRNGFSPHPYDWQATRGPRTSRDVQLVGVLDLNVDVIVGLMVLISIINMTSALLIIILNDATKWAC